MNKKTYRLRKLISVVIAALILVLSLTSYSSMDADAVNTSLDYNIYNGATGAYVSSYTLSANAVQDNSRVVIGTDNRVADPTHNGVVKIIKSDGRFSTGFVIDSNTIATAAHSVYDKTNDTSSYAGTSLSNIYVLNPNGTTAMNITSGYIQKIHIPQLYISTGGDESITNEYDYALITISSSIDLSDYAYYNLGVMLDGFKNSSKNIYVTGYPQKVNDVTVNSTSRHAIYTGTGTVISGFNPDLQIVYNCDTYYANSGGPVYTKSSYGDNDYYTVIGINTGESDSVNIGTRITTDLLHFYKNNPNI